MKAIKLVAVAALIAAPALSFAQASQGLTRAQVRAELIELEKAGYNPAGDHAHYPEAIEAASARLHAHDGASSNVAAGPATTEYGGVASGASNSGAPRVTGRAFAPSTQDDIPGLGPIYAHS
ncbi:DUF4148 domain-containing protein [Trinickia caryophylli]|uniref:DUF4148 domain-containing protein n=1 Tax=Trinickia caryophylli TaxID=28094 RepID=A0A1X7F2F7_TRICW|nr:DUF4148 domain-containing protein [Trinickia caryophylli]PMS10461.1 DUF4148 domain-containing protein [Trinickia caryophylli]TRX19494.1 DUF4148 domain-containing protein [Trinickia caryophylli]WQE13197.1 DUF4148 domain-containing protein [Trinickia caryophylli]SMF44712.1 protein of unknown function [Trinickia caryophylli]GLU34494.1 hypothetical protein Busp01_43360 [Trinickia caryophylli]